MKTVAERR